MNQENMMMVDKEAYDLDIIIDEDDMKEVCGNGDIYTILIKSIDNIEDLYKVSLVCKSFHNVFLERIEPIKEKYNIQKNCYYLYSNLIKK
jgi:hypothetical protein